MLYAISEDKEKILKTADLKRTGLSIRFEVGRNILKVDGTFYFIYIFIKCFVITTLFFPFIFVNFQPVKMFKY